MVFGFWQQSFVCPLYFWGMGPLQTQFYAAFDTSVHIFVKVFRSSSPGSQCPARLGGKYRDLGSVVKNLDSRGGRQGNKDAITVLSGVCSVVPPVAVDF